MTKLSLKLPWDTAGPTEIVNPTQSKFDASAFQAADAINTFAQLAVYVGASLMFFWMAWGVFDYLKAEGNKEALAKARKKIQWAIAGFIILLVSFFLSDFVRDFLLAPGGTLTKPQPVQNITLP